ncbi:hypothetical protein QN277_026428 [Acacia crassicarpa]|uniref:Uncharacterized protein n=1 Tax=Acacia crassicarpa TaxID=499986 RepID=A0AAE1J9B2_9FABA|nr:hypothetical protein QN277_026428 [Acacia crassicarpa]
MRNEASRRCFFGYFLPIQNPNSPSKAYCSYYNGNPFLICSGVISHQNPFFSLLFLRPTFNLDCKLFTFCLLTPLELRETGEGRVILGNSKGSDGRATESKNQICHLFGKIILHTIMIVLAEVVSSFGGIENFCIVHF